MFPSEMTILMAIAVTGNSDKKLLTRPMDVAGEYITNLYNALVKRGYLKGNSSKGYQLTSKGREALLEFLRRNENRVKETIRTLQRLGIAISLETDKMEKQVIKVK